MKDQFTLTYECEGHSIKASTLTVSIENLIEALSQIRYRVDPLSEVDVYVEAIYPGSFKVVLSNAYKKTNEFAKDNVVGIIILGVFINYIYGWLNPDKPPIIYVQEKYAVIKYNDQTIVIPIEFVKEYEKLKEIDSIKSPIRKTFQAVSADDAVNGFNIAFEGPDKRQISIAIPRSHFDGISREDEVHKRSKVKRETLIITRAILERSRRRWEFYLDSKRISCPILLSSFYDKFENHIYQIAPGDKLVVELKRNQRLDRQLDIWIDESYEITEVINLIQSPRDSSGQTTIPGIEK